MLAPTPIHKSLQKSLQKVREFLVELQAFDFGTQRTHRYHDIAEGNLYLSLTKEQAQTMHKCQEMLKAGLPDPDGFTARDILKPFEAAILEAVLGKQQPAAKRISPAVQTLGEELSKSLNQWEVHQPVGGLHHAGLPVGFGKVRFYWGDDRTCRALESVVKRILRTSLNEPEAKKTYRNHWAKEVEEDVKGKGFCRVIVGARSAEAAFGRALRELALTIDIVNLFADVTMSTGNGGRLYLPGEAHPTSGVSLTLELEAGGAKRRHGVAQNAPRSHISSYLAGPFSEFSMNEAARTQLAKFGWERASLILQKSESARSEMENRILAAMRWAGRATATELRDNDKQETYLVTEQAFLLYAIALESLLLKKESELSYRLSLRGAHLLGSNSTRRAQIQGELGDLYNLRSQIVHSGSSSVAPDQLSRLRSHTKNAIFILLMRRPFRTMQSEKEFREWFDSRLLR